jgi:hypothetical protein
MRCLSKSKRESLVKVRVPVSCALIDPMLTASNVLVRSEMDVTLVVGVDGADGRFSATSLDITATVQRIYCLDLVPRQVGRSQGQGHDGNTR